MIKKILFIIILNIYFIYINTFIILPSYLFKLNNKVADLTKMYGNDFINFIYQEGFSNIYYSGEYIKSNKIDIIISNHNTTIDFILNSILHTHFSNKKFNFLTKRDITYIPGFGFLISSSSDIKIKRSFDDDKDVIINFVKNINNGIIILMPEGTRYTKERHIEAVKYSRENNLPEFKNTLYPKMKGLWIIINILINENKLGNLIDFSNILENFKNENAFLFDIMKKNIGNTYTIIKTYQIPQNKSLQDYNNFKKWFLEIWKEKDKNIENYNKYNFKRLPIKLNYFYYMSIIINLIFIVYLIYKTNGKFLYSSIILLYIIIFIRNILRY